MDELDLNLSHLARDPFDQEMSDLSYLCAEDLIRHITERLYQIIKHWYHLKLKMWTLPRRFDRFE